MTLWYRTCTLIIWYYMRVNTIFHICCVSKSRILCYNHCTSRTWRAVFASIKGVNYSSRGPSVQSQAGVTSFTPGYAGIGLSFSVVQYSVNYVWGFKIQLNYHPLPVCLDCTWCKLQWRFQHLSSLCMNGRNWIMKCLPLCRCDSWSGDDFLHR